MADTIVELLTDVADAIREKKGSNKPINAQKFAEEIRNIQSGGDCDTIITAKPQVDNVFSWQELREIIVHEGVTTIGPNGFNYGYKLQTIKLPESLIKIDRSAFDNTSALVSLHIPSKVNTIVVPVARNSKLVSLSVSESNSVYDSRNNCNAIIETQTNTLILGSKNTTIPEGIVAIAESAFQGGLVERLIFPSSIISIGGAAFNSCAKLTICDFRSANQIPSLGNSNAFGSTPAALKIVVPDSLYDLWIKETNWSTLASKIIKASDYTE